MCTVNMTFEVPDSQLFDIEGFKQQVRTYVDTILAKQSHKENVIDTFEEWTEEQERDAFLATSRRNTAQICAKYL